MVALPVVILWLAVVPVKDGIVAFPPPARAFTTKSACEAWIKTIPDSKPEDFKCAPIFIVEDESLTKGHV